MESHGVEWLLEVVLQPVLEIALQLAGYLTGYVVVPTFTLGRVLVEPDPKKQVVLPSGDGPNDVKMEPTSWTPNWARYAG